MLKHYIRSQWLKLWNFDSLISCYIPLVLQISLHNLITGLSLVAHKWLYSWINITEIKCHHVHIKAFEVNKPSVGFGLVLKDKWVRIQPKVSPYFGYFNSAVNSKVCALFIKPKEKLWFSFYEHMITVFGTKSSKIWQ